MCAINGFNWKDENLILMMNEANRHRGPDDRGTFTNDGISLGHNRLSIIDLSPAGHQPMSYRDRFVITFNGEIYNFPELKEELQKKGHLFKSKSDTEVILAAYAEWGREAVKKLNGIFAFAIWDKEKKELFLARDHVGVKPLYYFWDGNKFIFSSEIKSILRHGVSREIDLDSLNVYFRFLYVPSPKTIWRDIFKLPAGHLAIIKNNQLAILPYWELKSGEPIGYGQALSEIRSLFKDSVKRQLITERPLGVFLSGGIDSTAVLGAMTEIVPGKIKTFSVGYEATAEEEKYNADFLLAEKTAKFYGTEHYPIKISGKDVRDCFEYVVYHMDEPVSNHIQPSTYLLAKHAREEVVVALGGDGGDELFGGYDRYFYNWWIDKARFAKPIMRTPVLSFLLGKKKGMTLFQKLQTEPGLDRFLSFMAQKEEVVDRFLKKEINRVSVARFAFAPYFKTIDKDFTNQMMMADIKTWLPDESLVRSDKLTMAHALEERVPILDHHLVELAFRVPSGYKVESHRLGKKIWREAIAKYLPPGLEKEKKRGFFSPASKWLRGELKEFAYEVLSKSYTKGTDDYFDFVAVRKILDDHLNIRGYGLPTIWSLMTFQVWYKQFMGR